MPVSIAEVPTRASRILVYGVTGSGKSTAAERIGERTGLPVTLVDELTWLPGWVPVDAVRQREQISAVTSGDHWVLDSAYGAWLDLVLPRAELIVALDYPRWFSLQRLIRRTIRGAVTKSPRCNGNTETIRQIFGKDSILRWHFKSFDRKRDRIRHWSDSPDVAPVLTSSTSRQLEAWLSQLHPGR